MLVCIRYDDLHQQLIILFVGHNIIIVGTINAGQDGIGNQEELQETENQSI